jgi:hypothetical protein
VTESKIYLTALRNLQAREGNKNSVIWYGVWLPIASTQLECGSQEGKGLVDFWAIEVRARNVLLHDDDDKSR